MKKPSVSKLFLKKEHQVILKSLIKLAKEEKAIAAKHRSSAEKLAVPFSK